MAKMHVTHRVVMRDQTGGILSDVEYASFATGEPAYRIAAQDIPRGHFRSTAQGKKCLASEYSDCA